MVKPPGMEAFDRLGALLGEEILDEDGQIDKGIMAEKIFADEDLLAKVNQIVHPAVKDFLMEKYHAAKANPEVELFFVEAALLIEAGYQQIVDELWYIYAHREVREKRLREARGYSDEKIARIMSSQLSEEEFRTACDFVIDNSGLPENSYLQIDKKLEAFTWRE